VELKVERNCFLTPLMLDEATAVSLTKLSIWWVLSHKAPFSLNLVGEAAAVSPSQNSQFQFF
jgi:hypothetical protein